MLKICKFNNNRPRFSRSSFTLAKSMLFLSVWILYLQFQCIFKKIHNFIYTVFIYTRYTPLVLLLLPLHPPGSLLLPLHPPGSLLLSLHPPGSLYKIRQIWPQSVSHCPIPFRIFYINFNIRFTYIFNFS